MLLVSPESLTAVKERPTSTESVTAGKLDQELKDVLNQVDISPYDKVQRYNQILQRYLAFYNQTTKRPLSVKLTHVTNPNLEHQPPHQEDINEGLSEALTGTMELDTHTKTKLLSHFPVRFKNKGEAILNLIHDSGGILSWNKQGELSHSGKLLKGSHVSDLIYDLLQDRRGLEPPLGFDSFLKGLVEINIPERLVTNSYRRTQLQNIKQHGLITPRTSRYDESAPPANSKKRTKRKKGASTRSPTISRIGRLNWEDYPSH